MRLRMPAKVKAKDANIQICRRHAQMPSPRSWDDVKITNKAACEDRGSRLQQAKIGKMKLRGVRGLPCGWEWVRKRALGVLIGSTRIRGF